MTECSQCQAEAVTECTECPNPLCAREMGVCLECETRGVEAAALSGQACEWFALCEREAVTLVPHAALGHVPACGKCAQFAGYPA